MRTFSMILFFAVAGVSSAQQPPPPGTLLPAPPGTQLPAPPGTKSAAEPIPSPKDKNSPIVVFCRIPARPIPGFTVYRDDSWSANAVVEVFPNGVNDYGMRYARDVTDAEVAGSGRGIQAAQPRPFQKSLVQREAQEVGDSSSPWYEKGDVEKIKAKWPTTVAFPPNLRFYSLTPSYQHMYTMNGGRSRITEVSPISREGESHPFLVSGGMAKEMKNRFNQTVFEVLQGWRSDKGFAFDGTLAKVWKEPTNVRAFSLVDRWRWKFNPGVTAYDVLSNDAGEPFEIRTQTKEDDDTWSTKVVFKDLSKAPAGYTGLEQSCASCHSHTGEILGREGQLYLWERWGSDGRYSWRPYRGDNSIDPRWPIELK